MGDSHCLVDAVDGADSNVLGWWGMRTVSLRIRQAIRLSLSEDLPPNAAKWICPRISLAPEGTLIHCSFAAHLLTSPISPSLTEQQLRVLCKRTLEDCDHDQDGTLNKEEFVKVFALSLSPSLSFFLSVFYFLLLSCSRFLSA